MKYIVLLLSIFFGVLAAIYYFGYYTVIFDPVDIPTVAFETDAYEKAKLELIGSHLGVFLAILFYVLALYFYSIYHRCKKRKKGTYLYEEIKEPFVLYLRSFIDDKTTRKRISALHDARSEEEIVVEVLSDIAPVYAIGDPRDNAMPLGASRVYVEDANWKTVVADMAERAAVVVLRLGKTDSFWWEVDMVLKKVPVEKILFVIPKSNTFNNLAALYKILLSHGIDISTLNISVGQNQNGSIASFLFFDKHEKPATSAIKIHRFTRLLLLYENVVRNSLALFREKFGLETAPLKTINKARVLQISIIICVILLFVLGLSSDLLNLKYQSLYYSSTLQP